MQESYWPAHIRMPRFVEFCCGILQPHWCHVLVHCRLSLLAWEILLLFDYYHCLAGIDYNEEFSSLRRLGLPLIMDEVLWTFMAAALIQCCGGSSAYWDHSTPPHLSLTLRMGLTRRWVFIRWYIKKRKTWIMWHIYRDCCTFLEFFCGPGLCQVTRYPNIKFHFSVLFWYMISTYLTLDRAIHYPLVSDCRDSKNKTKKKDSLGTLQCFMAACWGLRLPWLFHRTVSEVLVHIWYAFAFLLGTRDKRTY